MPVGHKHACVLPTFPLRRRTLPATMCFRTPHGDAYRICQTPRSFSCRIKSPRSPAESVLITCHAFNVGINKSSEDASRKKCRPVILRIRYQRHTNRNVHAPHCVALPMLFLHTVMLRRCTLAAMKHQRNEVLQPEAYLARNPMG